MLNQQGTIVVNGQLVSQVPSVSQYVSGYAPYSAVGSSGPLTIPPTVGSMGLNTGTLTGTADSNAQAAQNASKDPWNPKVSPVVPALVALLIAIVMLDKVHFREEGKASEGG